MFSGRLAPAVCQLASPLSAAQRAACPRSCWHDRNPRSGLRAGSEQARSSLGAGSERRPRRRLGATRSGLGAGSEGPTQAWYRLGAGPGVARNPRSRLAGGSEQVRSMFGAGSEQFRSRFGAGSEQARSGAAYPQQRAACPRPRAPAWGRPPGNIVHPAADSGSHSQRAARHMCTHNSSPPEAENREHHHTQCRTHSSAHRNHNTNSFTQLHRTTYAQWQGRGPGGRRQTPQNTPNVSPERPQYKILIIPRETEGHATSTQHSTTLLHCTTPHTTNHPN